MAQFGGISKRTLVNSLEVLADDGSLVLMLDNIDMNGGGGLRIRVRKPFENAYGTYPTFTVLPQERSTLSKMVGNHDFSWEYNTIKDLPVSDFTAEDPNPPAAKEDCSALDIERAKAANLAEERELLRLSLVRDHTNDKHIAANIIGCEMCEEAANAAFTHGTYDPDDDSTKTPDRGYGEE